MLLAELPPLQINTDISTISAIFGSISVPIGGAIVACVNKILTYLKDEGAARDKREDKHIEIIEKSIAVLTRVVDALDDLPKQAK